MCGLVFGVGAADEAPRRVIGIIPVGGVGVCFAGLAAFGIVGPEGVVAGLVHQIGQAAGCVVAVNDGAAGIVGLVGGSRPRQRRRSW